MRLLCPERHDGAHFQKPQTSTPFHCPRKPTLDVPQNPLEEAVEREHASTGNPVAPSSPAWTTTQYIQGNNACRRRRSRPRKRAPAWTNGTDQARNSHRHSHAEARKPPGKNGAVPASRALPPAALGRFCLFTETRLAGAGFQTPPPAGIIAIDGPLSTTPPGLQREYDKGDKRFDQLLHAPFSRAILRQESVAGGAGGTLNKPHSRAVWLLFMYSGWRTERSPECLPRECPPFQTIFPYPAWQSQAPIDARAVKSPTALPPQQSYGACSMQGIPQTR